MKEIKTYYIRTYGCQMNELDSEVITGLLHKRGLTPADDETDADLIIFNTCSVRDLAERKVMGKIGKLSHSPAKDAIIGVMGCMAMAKKETLFKKLPHVDFVIGTNNIKDINEVLDEVITTGQQVLRTSEKPEKQLPYTTAFRKDNVTASVSIIRGCNNFCTYCIVPYTRGREISRPHQEIIDECQQLSEQGYREVTLLGQNVNSYGKDKESEYPFHELLYHLDKIPGIERIRFMTSHPVDITKELMQAVNDLPSVCEFVHFPIQAGANRILKKMNRQYTKEEYLEKIRLFREICPNVALGTDIIVGFPTETDAEFDETYQVMQEIEYSMAFIFAYSPRKGTPATRWGDDIPKATKEQRLQKLLALQNIIYEKHRKQMLGQTIEVLVERQNYKDHNLLKGRSRCWKNVLFPGDPKLIGTIQRIKIDDFHHQTLLGTIDL